ncbi:MAG TPA: ribosome recycling factor [Gillisia sp.]|nr:ribosome recycling factor [Gillisia sp.]
MNEEVDFILESTEENMQKALKHLEKQLLNIRAGKASPAMLGSVMVEYYGAMTPLQQVANVNTPDARTITIQPFERKSIPDIQKGIMLANLGFNPMQNADSVIINVPPLTEERRRELSKQAKAEAEEAKIGIRNDRKVANNDLKKLEISEDLSKIAEENVQILTDTYIKKVDVIFENKEKEIMTV